MAEAEENVRKNLGLNGIIEVESVATISQFLLEGKKITPFV